MKRSVLNAFTEAIDEIVARGKLKDEEGALFYPVMAEPAVMAFFGAPEALSEVILHRPILLINMIRTNKALQRFWEQTPDIWITLIDNFVLRESDPLFLETYPFFAVVNHRARAVLDLVPDVQEWVKKRYGDGDFMYKSLFSGPFNEPGKLLGHDYSAPEEVRYQLVYYNDLTQEFIEMLQLVQYLQYDYVQRERLFFADSGQRLALYIGNDSPIGMINCLDDCFLIDKRRLWEDKRATPIEFNLVVMRHTVEQVKQAAAFYKLGDINTKDGKTQISMGSDLIVRVFGSYPKSVIDMFTRVKTLANSLSVTLANMFQTGTRNGVPYVRGELPVYIDLTKEIATPYRSMLYDKEQGIYNTPDKQRTLLLSLLRRAEKNSLGGEMIVKYGECMPLACSVCRKETHMVDPLLKKAFCTESCYAASPK